MLDWFLFYANPTNWWGKTVACHVTATVTVTCTATVDTSGGLAKDQIWYIAHPYAPIKAGPVITHTPAVARIDSALVAQEPASITLAVNVVRGVESILVRTEANAHLVDWALVRGVNGSANGESMAQPLHGTVEDVAAIEHLLGVHL